MRSIAKWAIVAPVLVFVWPIAAAVALIDWDDPMGLQLAIAIGGVAATVAWAILLISLLVAAL